MTDSVLTNDQAMALLRMLATDEEFRALFQSKPAKALFKLGVEPERIVDLKPACLCPPQIAGMKDFQQAVDRMDKSILQETASMQSPKLWLGS